MKYGKLITETSYDLEVSRGTRSKDTFIVGIFSSAQVENANSRRYPREILEREIEKFMNEKVTKRSAFGELNHPPNPEINLDKVAIMTETLEWKGNDVLGRAKVLDTPNGKILKTLLESGGRVGISSRGLGTVNEDGWVNEDYQLICYDVVGSPSNQGSWVKGVLEGKDFPIADIDEKEVKITLEQAQGGYFKYIMEALENIGKTVTLQDADVGSEVIVRPMQAVPGVMADTRGKVIENLGKGRYRVLMNDGKELILTIDELQPY